MGNVKDIRISTLANEKKVTFMLLSAFLDLHSPLMFKLTELKAKIYIYMYVDMLGYVWPMDHL